MMLYAKEWRESVRFGYLYLKIGDTKLLRAHVSADGPPPNGEDFVEITYVETQDEMDFINDIMGTDHKLSDFAGR